MSRLKRWHRTIILTICLTLIPFGAFGQAASSPFTDVPTSHWSLAHVTKMELRDIITGYGNNIFKPENTVSQLEATTMAIRAMGLEREANNIGASNVNTSIFDLPTTWNAAGYVSVAIEKGLIDTDNFRPNQGASRAWVAQLIIRMVGAETEAQSQASSTTFIDDFAIAANYKKYVALAAEKDIINGVRNNSGAYEFKPNNLVKRAELAAMISRSDRYMQDVEGQLPIATVQSITGQQVEVAKTNGNTDKHFTTSSTHMFNANGNQISTANLKENDLIRYAVNQAGVFTFIEVLDKQHYQEIPTVPTVQQNMLQGKIAEHLPEASLIVVRDEEGVLHTHTYINNVTVRDSVTNQTLAITDLAEGDKVQVRLLNGVVTEINLASKATSGISKGKIYALNLETGILTLEQNSRYSSYTISNQVIVEYEGVRFPTVRDLRVGDEVEVTVEEQSVEGIKLLTPYQKETSEGKIVALSSTDRIVTIRTQTDGLKAYDLPIDTEITIQGVNNPSINDLLIDDNITFTVENNKITTMEVKNRVYQNEVRGEVINRDIDRMLLTIEDEQKELKIFKIDDYVFLDLDKSNPKIDDVRVGMIVNLKLDKNIIKEISTTNKVEGKIEAVDENRNFITINDGSRRTNYNLSDNYVDIWMIDISYPRFRDLKEGQEVILHLEENEVNKIEVKEERHTTITRVREDYNRIEVKHGSSEKEYRIESNTKITIPGLSNTTIDDLRKDDIVTLKFVGSELKEVIVVPPYYGHISSVDGSRVVLETRADTETIRINSSLTVKNTSANEMSASNLREHDYVKVVRVGDKYTLTQASVVEGELFSVSTSQGRIYFYDSNRSYRNYELGRDVVAWKGSASYLLGDLEQGMKISMYMFDNKVVGIRVK